MHILYCIAHLQCRADGWVRDSCVAWYCAVKDRDRRNSFEDMPSARFLRDALVRGSRRGCPSRAGSRSCVAECERAGAARTASSPTRAPAVAAADAATAAADAQAVPHGRVRRLHRAHDHAEILHAVHAALVVPAGCMAYSLLAALAAALELLCLSLCGVAH